MSQQLFRTAVIVVAALALSACAKSFTSNVTSFHSVTPPAGAKVILVPIDEAKQDSLEYRQYASALQAMAERAGFVGAREDEPDYIIGFDVSVNDGREKLRSTFAGGGFGGFGGSRYWHRGFAWGGWWNPGFGGFGGFGGGYQGQLTARTVYRAQVHIEIRKPSGEMVFEATAETESRKRSLPELVPLLAEALFKEFPGENGRTRRVKIDLSEAG